MNDDSLKQAWHEQPTEAFTMSTAERARFARRARRFDVAIRVRNLLEYAAGGFVAVTFAFYFLVFSGPVMRTGCVLVILGTAAVMVQLRRRGSPLRRLPASFTESCVAFHRAELVRQRDALRSVWVWYLMPMVPGLAVFMGGTLLEMPATRASGWWAIPLVAGVFAAVAWANHVGARRLQNRIEALDRLSA